MNTLILKQGEKKISGLLFISMIIMIALLNSCGGNEPGGGTDDRKGPPYKFRVEVSAEKPEILSVLSATGNFNYVDENGLPRTVWYAPQDIKKMPSPYILEFDVPRNFYKFMYTSNLIGVELMSLEEEMKGIIVGKLYVNNKLLTSFSNKYWWITTIGYDEKSKKYEVKTSDGKVFETNKID